MVYSGGDDTVAAEVHSDRRLSLNSRAVDAFTALTLLTIISFAPSAAAQQPLAGEAAPQPTAAIEVSFDDWLVELRAEALAAGIRSEILDAALAGINPVPRIIELDRSQPEFTLTFDQYMARVVPQQRIQLGRQKLAQHADLLSNVSRAYGVQARFIVALWGIETDFGRVTGGFKVIEALATLAFDGRRSAYFRGELLNALTILDEGHITPEEMVGSWAGAMGQSQFMPSSFLQYAVDYTGDGRRDIWTTEADVFASAANYLKNSGWNDTETWGRAVRLPDNLDPDLISLDVVKTIPEWQALGVRKSSGAALPGRAMDASIIYASDDESAAFMVYGNFKSTLKWNRSKFFALAVGHLADGIGAE